MSSTLHDYAETPAPKTTLVAPIRKSDVVIGHFGEDAHRGRIAAFPRNRHGKGEADQHYFRKYAGYAISEDILNQVRGMGVNSIFILERDDTRIVEYDPVAFTDGEVVAYDPEANTIIEGKGRIERNRDGFEDIQYVAPEATAKTTWNRSEVKITKQR
ncbi:hypothetical protein M1M18_gp079 [Halorubrum virus Serpecor1]|uniref:Uncharacterized protein n=1 Tax=Halorubrum virus Serpecor1 TaxID=2721757 RepID=A0A6G9RWX5_9CAUD|nr:hypothetical protein M1M18_gp079 [Halorubrum virus Serpecor1]QIR31221.1 hypothetical protein HrrSp1_285 [Halorubrum virus Serpecor1]